MLEDGSKNKPVNIYEHDVQLSQAISLKRIADALEKLINTSKADKAILDEMMFNKKEQ